MTGSGYQNLVEAFFAYLASLNTIPEHVLAQAQSFFLSPGDIRVGQISVLLGYLKPRDVLNVVAAQVDSDSKFGELAVQLGMMTQEQVDAALASQSNRCLQVLELVRLNYRLEDADAQKLLAEFPAWLEQHSQSALLLDPNEASLRSKDGERIKAALRKISKLASLPTVVQRVLAMLQDPNIALEKIAKTLEGDPPMAAQVLRLANSAFFGMRQKVTTLLRAMVVLGLTNVRQVVLGATVITQFSAGTKAEQKAFWFQSIFTGQWARCLAARPPVKVAPEEAFIAGLMCDIGQMVVRQHFPKDYLEIQARMKRGVLLTHAERQVLGLTHPDIGAHLAHSWNFPAQLEEAVLYSHTPSSAIRRLKLLEMTKLVNAACRLAELAPGSDVVTGFTLLDADFLDAHDLGRSTPLELAPKVLEETKQLCAALLV